MPSLETDLRFVEEGLRALQDYLLSDVLFWPLSGSLPRLTPGGLLLAEKRLAARQAGLHMTAQLEALRTKWRVNWEAKVRREFAARYNLWKNYLEDYRVTPAVAENYAHEVTWRTMMTLLTAELSAAPAEMQGLAALDRFVEGSFVRGAFVWEAALQPEFPEDIFWFLYGTLKGEQDG